MKDIIKNNFSAFCHAFKSPLLNNDVVCKPFQLKYTFIPILLLVSCFFFNIDIAAENYVKYDMPGSLTYYFNIITRFGLAIYLLIPLGIIVLARLFIDADKLSEKVRHNLAKLNSYAWFLLATVAVSGIVGQVLKFVIGRARPKFFLEYGSHYFQHFHKPGYDFASMPSGHSITVAAFCMGLIYLAPKFRVLWILLAVAVAFSRIVLGSHYPSDVVFGLAIGCYSTVFVYYWMRNRELI
ncbi:MAG: membrane-associated phospholipid phosphatase [Francisella sp.]|jgi:membrane-associated phospholipid phosphatase